MSTATTISGLAEDPCCSLNPTRPARAFSLSVTALVFALFLYAGDFKADPRLSWLGIDMTVLFAVVSAVLGAVKFARSGFRLPQGFLWIVSLFVILAIPVLWTQWSDYAINKVARLFTLTLLAATLAPLLFQTAKESQQAMDALALFGLVIAADAVHRIAQAGGFWEANARLTAAGTNTIGLGRDAGLVAIVLVHKTIQFGFSKCWPALLVLPAIVTVMVGSGSRGPILAMIFSLALYIFMFDRGQTWLRYRALLITLILALLFPLASLFAPEQSIKRIDRFLLGQYGHSELVRLEAYRLSLNHIPTDMQGVGWGGFERINNIATRGSNIIYPHNLILELFVEGGWAVGLAVVGAVVALALKLSRQSMRSDSSSIVKLLAALFLFTFFNSLVSGDINDCRVFFAFFGLGVCAHEEWLDSVSGET